MYDRFGHAGLGGAATGGFDPNAFSGFEDILGGLGDIFGFGDVFGGGAGAAVHSAAPTCATTSRSRSTKPPRASKRRFRFRDRVSCETCGGNGAAAGTQPVTCPQCQGRGQLRYQQGFFTVARTCNQCRGSGSIISKPCRPAAEPDAFSRRRSSASGFQPGSRPASDCGRAAQRRAVARQPDVPRQYVLLSNILEKMGRLDEAHAPTRRSRGCNISARRLSSIIKAAVFGLGQTIIMLRLPCGRGSPSLQP